MMTMMTVRGRRLQRPKRVRNSPVATTDILPLQRSGVDDHHLAESEFLHV